MRYLMRIELTRVSSINDLLLVKLVHVGIVVPLSWGVFTLVCFTRLNSLQLLIGLYGTTTPSQSGPGSDGNEGVLCIPQSSGISGTS